MEIAIWTTICLCPLLHGGCDLCAPLCDHKLAWSQLKHKGCLGRSRVAQRTFRPRPGRHGRREVLSMFKTVTQRSQRRSVGKKNVYCCKNYVLIWAMLLPRLYHHCASFGRPIASIERSQSATTATLHPPWKWFCLHPAYFTRPVVPLQQCWWFKEGTGVVLQQLTQKQNFLCLGDHWA